MAHTLSPTRVNLTHLIAGIRHRLAYLSNKIAEGAPAQTLGDARLARVRALQSKSDAQLARLGLARADITTRVFRDNYYL